MPAKRKFIDFDCQYLINVDNDVVIFCACGHKARLTPDVFRRWPRSSLYRVLDKVRCSACGAVGDVPEIRMLPRNTGGFAQGRA